jgi:predicted DNA-binding transcriptional regulator AlpA
MNKHNLLNTKEIAAVFGISRSTLSRWVERGCPHQKEANQQVFCLKEVEEWMEKNKDPESNLLKSRRSLKRYHVFNCDGYYKGEVMGSAKLIAQLKKFEAFDHYHPYGIDENGFIYYIYSGKLRKHDSVKGIADVHIFTRYHPEIEVLMEAVRQWYVGGKFKSMGCSARGTSSPLHPPINFLKKLNKT